MTKSLARFTMPANKKTVANVAPQPTEQEPEEYEETPRELYMGQFDEETKKLVEQDDRERLDDATLDVVENILEDVDIENILLNTVEMYSKFYFRHTETARLNRGGYQLYELELKPQYAQPLTIEVSSTVLSRQTVYISRNNKCPSGANSEWKGEEKGINRVDLTGINFTTGKYYVGVSGIVSGKYRIDIKTGDLQWVNRKLPNGDFYTGMMCRDMKHGVGTIVYKSGDKHRGQFVNDMPCGEGVFEGSNGDRLEGLFSGNILVHGKGIRRCKNGQVFEGTFHIDGEGSLEELTQIQEEGGIIVHVSGRYENGDIYTGDWFGTVRQGKGKYVITSSQCTYEGEWFDDKYHGTGTLTYPGGRSVEGQWIDGKVVRMGMQVETVPYKNRVEETDTQLEEMMQNSSAVSVGSEAGSQNTHKSAEPWLLNRTLTVKSPSKVISPKKIQLLHTTKSQPSFGGVSAMPSKLSLASMTSGRSSPTKPAKVVKPAGLAPIQHDGISLPLLVSPRLRT